MRPQLIGCFSYRLRGPTTQVRKDGEHAPVRGRIRREAQLESELDEELSRGSEVVDHDADVVHPLDRHVLDGKEPGVERGR